MSKALTPHDYPLWVRACAAFIGMLLVVALWRLPPYYRSAKLVRNAGRAAQMGNTRSAIGLYQAALLTTPTSETAKIGLAATYFQSGDRAEGVKALELIRDIPLAKSDWERLSKVMPPEYQKLVIREKR
jgi:hypothetical protein